MQKIMISDVTLRESETSNFNLSFREKIEVAKKLDKLNTDIIETQQIKNERTDVLFLHTISPLIKNSIISCPVGYDERSIEMTADAISQADKKRLHLMVPTSPVQMEYMCHKKPKAIIEMIDTLIKKCKSVCDDVEFSALDATRSEKEFLYTAIKTAVDAGAKTITVCDSAGEMLPDEFGTFINELYENVPVLKDVTLGVMCADSLYMGTACMISSIKAGARVIKTTVDGYVLPSLYNTASIINTRGDSMDVYSGIDVTALKHSVDSILYMSHKNSGQGIVYPSVSDTDTSITLTKSDDIKTVSAVIKKMGYDLSDEDISNVYAEFLKVAQKKQVGIKELDAIIASTALQVSPTYKLVSYVINSGNIINASAHIALLKDGKEIHKVCIGDGPIDAAFITIEEIVGRHFELDDFQIQSITEGTEAVGSAVVKLRSDGKLYSGKGISTDIIGASINAYINAINKIYFEEE